MRNFRFVVIAVLALAALAVSGGSITAGAPSTQGQKVRPEVVAALEHEAEVRVVISLRDNPALLAPLDIPALRQDVASKQERVLSSLTASDFTLIRRYEAVPGLAGWISQGGIESLADHQDVVSVGMDLEVHAALGESVAQIGADDVQALGITGADVVVAVLDTGIDTDHDDLKDDLLSGDCFLSGGELCPNGSTTCHGTWCAEDDHGHGTHVSGIITSGGVRAAVGVAPDAGIRSLKVLNGSGDWASNVTAGLDYIIAYYHDTDLVNMSLGSSEVYPPGSCDGVDPSMESAIATLRAGGTTVFASSGNDGVKDRMEYPACFSTVISVGSVYDADLGEEYWPPCYDASTTQDQVVCESNSDASLDLLAPGCRIRSSDRGGGAYNWCGTSMASPHAVGAAALLLDIDASLTPDEIETCLEDTGVEITDPGNGVTTPRVDVVAALDCPEIDSDGDEYSNVDEGKIGTDPAKHCPDTPDENDEEPDAWPPDFDDNRVVNITDTFQVLPPYYGSSCYGGPPYSARRDLAPDCVINITDVFKVMPPVFGSSCTP